MDIHILGICGTFMGGIARIAKELGYEVSGSDQNVYPPMSTQLLDMGITLKKGYSAQNLQPTPSCVVIGNAMSRGNEAVETVLNEGMLYESGPSWLKKAVLDKRWVIAVSGTHGKTTTSSMVAWILEYAGLNPGFLIGGVPENFGVSARLGDSPYFVIEADEYDTAFFDKRSKFVHYHPKTCIINNLEFDHADIFENLDAIKKQFHHLMRSIPQKGTVIYPQVDQNIQDVLKMGCWSEQQSFGNTTDQHDAPWRIRLDKEDASEFTILQNNKACGKVKWDLLGEHNAMNALAAIIAAHSIGVEIEVACQALAKFKSVKRRLEKIGEVQGVSVYDDFAHHPTAITQTLRALRRHVGSVPIMAVLDLRSNSMKMGIHSDTIASSLNEADQIWVYQSDDVKWSVEDSFSPLKNKAKVCRDTEDIIQDLVQQLDNKSHVCVMSNGGFDNFHQRLMKALKDKQVA